MTACEIDLRPGGRFNTVMQGPDGEVVEKGSVAQWLRTSYATAQATRKVYTCVGCSTGTTRTLTVPNASGTISLEGHAHAAADITSGTFDNARINWAAPSAIGSTTSAAGTFTTLTGTTQIVGPQGSTVGSASSNAITLGAACLILDELLRVRRGR